MSGGVFISYRGEDSFSYGALLHAELAREFGPELVFLDSESIPPGTDYVEELLGRVRQARVVLAVIGARWLAAQAPGGGRCIDDPADWIRRELVAAFAAGVRVVPVLTDGAGMPTVAELPADLAALGRCQFRRLRHRDASADLARLVAELAELDAGLGAARQSGPYPAPEVMCPYPGMVPFGPQDAPFFRGREKLLASLVSRVAVQVRRGGGPLVVVGPSGVGKSSLLRAGLLPALAAGDLPVEGSAGWPRLYLRPGPDPLAELSAHLGTVGLVEENLPEVLRATPTALRQLLGRSVGSAAFGPVQGGEAPRPGGDRRVVVVVDQLEELFTHGSTETDRLALVRALLAAGQPCGVDPAPAVVLFGLRADFYAHCAQVPELVPWLQDSQVLITAMTPDQRRQAIVGPAESVGLQIEPGLAELLVAEASGESLPQLAHVLRRTFAHRRGRALTVEGYRATGGIAQAVATTADAVYDALNEADQRLLRRLMVSLVAVVDGAEDTRRRVPREQLLGASAQARRDGDRVLCQLIAQRLVTAEDETYMLSHEALIRAWPRLKGWLSQDRDGLRLHRELSHRAHAWQRHGRDPGSLYAGVELELARRWVTQHADHLQDVERDFYHASLAAEKAAQAATDAQHRTRRRQLRIVSALLALAVTAGLLAWQQRGHAIGQQHAATRQQHAAEAAGRTALSRQLAAQSQPLIDTDPDLASLLAVESYRLDPTEEAAHALTAASRLPLQRRIAGHTGPVNAVAFSPDSTTLATTSDDRTARLWDAHTGHPTATLTGHTGNVNAVAFSPNGTTLATTSNDGTARLWPAIPPPSRQIDMICDAVGRSLAEQEWSHYVPGQPYERICLPH